MDNIISKAIDNDSDYFGVDASNEISLFEYGLLMKQNKDGYQVIFGMETGNSGDYRVFGTAQIDREEPFETLEDLADEDFYSYTDTTRESYRKDEYGALHALSDLLGYYGYLNVFGTQQARIEIG